jgi:hypothetical protein
MSDENFGAAVIGGIVALVVFTQGAAMLNGFGDLFSFLFFLIVLAGAFVMKALGLTTGQFWIGVWVVFMIGGMISEAAKLWRKWRHG